MSAMYEVIYCSICQQETPCKHVGSINRSIDPERRVHTVKVPMTIQRILDRYNIHTLDDLDVAIENYGRVYEDLYVYFLDSGEMPYGVAKARTGDLGTWMYERISSYLRQ